MAMRSLRGSAGEGYGGKAEVTAWLDPAELYRLTRKVRFGAQCRALTKLGIPFTKAVSGEPIVYHASLDAKPKPARNRGPNWDRIGA